MKTAIVAAVALMLASPTWAEKPSPAIPKSPAEVTTAPTPAVQNTQNTAPRPQFANSERALALPAGTTVWMKLESAISTTHNKAGDPFAGRVIAPVVLQGKTMIPAGASIAGHVIKVSEKRRYRGRPLIDLHPESITMPNGDRFDINAVVAATNSNTGTSVNDEGEIHGNGMDREDKVEMVAGSGAGLTIGALAGGAKGAFIGAAIGATATAVHWLSKTKSAELPAGTEIMIELGRPITLSASGAGT
jgi:hypothetical protein